MDLFIQQVAFGLATGGIYATLALALVLTFRATAAVNFAQGEMAMFATFFAWQLVAWGIGYWLAFLLTIGASFVAGLLVHRIVIRPVEGQSPLTITIVTIGLFLFFNSLAGFIWGFVIRRLDSPFPGRFVEIFAGARVSTHSIGVLAVVAFVVFVLWLLFQKTKIGLAMRAVAANPQSARLVGIRNNQMLMLGWGLAAGVGAVSGILVAPILFVDPFMMSGVLIYAFASATLGGFESPLGAVIGGLIVGVSENLAGTYLVGADLKILVPLIIIFVVLLVRPQGLFGHAEVVRA